MQGLNQIYKLWVKINDFKENIFIKEQKKDNSRRGMKMGNKDR